LTPAIGDKKANSVGLCAGVSFATAALVNTDPSADHADEDDRIDPTAFLILRVFLKNEIRQSASPHFRTSSSSLGGELGGNLVE